METLQQNPSEQNNPYFEQLLLKAQEDLCNNPNEVTPNSTRGIYWHYLLGQDIHTPPDSANRRKMLQLSQYLENNYPIVAAATQALYDQAIRHEDAPDSPDRWYADGVEDAHLAFTGMNSFFQQLQNKNPSPELSDFLNIWQKQIQMTVAEGLGLYTAVAIHLRRSPCAVYFGSLPISFPQDRPTREVFDELIPLWNDTDTGSPNVLQQFLPHLGQLVQWQKDNNYIIPINMPAIVNAFDFREYLRSLKDFWSELGATQLPSTTIHQEPNTVSIQLSRQAHIFIRHLPDRNGQARINIAGRGNRHRGISYRIDRERSGKLGIDFCRVGYDELLKIAQGISKLDPALVNEYTHALDSQGRMKAGVGPFYAPTLNRGIKELNAGHVFGMLAALGMKEGKSLGIQRGPTFNYHVSGVMDPFEANFEQLSREFAGLFP